MSERAAAAVYPVRAPVSAPRRRILAPSGRANPLHRRPRRSPPNRRAARRRHPRLTVPPHATVYAHELMPRRRLRAGEARHVFPGRLPCAGEVTAAVQACRAAVRTLVPAKLGRPWAARATLAEAEPGQAGPRMCCAGRLRQHCATGPSADSAHWHLIIFLYFLNIFNSLQIQNFV
jgi:hypothetical protein